MSSTPAGAQPAVVDLVPISQTTSLHRARAEALTVEDEVGYVTAGNLLVELRGYVKDVKAKLGPGIDSAKKHLDFLKNQQTEYVLPIEQIIAIVETKGESWRAADKKRRLEEQAAKQKEIDDKAKADAEAARLRDEAAAAEKKAARVEEIRDLLRKKKISKRAAEKLLREAGAAEEADKAAAAAKEEEAKAAPTPVVRVASSVPKVAGIKGRTNYKFEVTDASKIPREYLMPDLVKIGDAVRKTKHSARAMALIPGIKAWEEESI